MRVFGDSKVAIVLSNGIESGATATKIEYEKTGVPRTVPDA